MPVNPRGDRWQASVTFKGTRLRKDFATEREARSWEVLTLQQIKSGVLTTSQKVSVPTLSEHLDKVYVSRWAGTKGEQTAMINARHVVEVLGPDRLVSTLTKDDALTLKTAFLKRNIKGSTINRKLAAFSTLVKEAVEFGYLQQGFTVGLAKESLGRVRFYTVAEEVQMLDWCRQWAFDELADYITISVDTGFRQGEILKITARDCGQDNLWTFDTKNGANREIPVSDRVKEVLTRRAHGLHQAARIFTIKPAALRRHWRKMLDHLGWEDHTDDVPHALRHTFVTRCLFAGVDIKTVQELAGHKNITTTQRYAQTSPERKMLAIQRLSQYQVQI